MIKILRLGHRLGRDDRISTHCGLVGRALGADEIIYTGELGNEMLDSIKKISQRWGGKFKVSFEASHKKVIEKHKKNKFFVVHLTMYGLPMQNNITKIRKKKNILVVVGGEKVPGEVYALADMNIGVTNQPHSEVGALAVFLHDYFQGKELGKRFNKSKIRVIPQERGKKVVGK